MAGEQWLVAGLGNPGDKYLRTRHNLGFMAMEVLTQIWGLRLQRAKFKGLYEKADLRALEAKVSARYRLRPIGRQTLPEVPEAGVILLKPCTYMNASGESIREALHFFKIPSERLIVMYDDFDLPCGQIRLREKGGAGTHNGMRSVLAQLKTENFIRLRIGCGPLPPGRAVIDYVMENIPPAEQEGSFHSLETAAKAVRLLLRGGVPFALNYINTEEQKKQE